MHQAHGVALLRSIGGKVYIIGHPSPADGRTHRGTGQTPGLPDVFAFLPPRRLWADEAPTPPPAKPIALWWEAKGAGGRLRPEQAEFRSLCLDAELQHVVGDLDALIAFLCEHHYCKAAQFPHYRQPQGVVTR